MIRNNDNDDDHMEVTEDLFSSALWAHDLITWAARLEVAVTHGYELAAIERWDEPAGEVLMDQLAGLPADVTTDIVELWPGVRHVFFSTDPMFAQVVAFVLDRAAMLRATAQSMALAAVIDREAA